MKVEREAYTLDEFVEAFKIGRTKLFEEIAAKRLSAYRVGRRRYISRRAAEDWQRAHERAFSESLA